MAHPPFLPRHPTAHPHDSAILHLRRDQLVPTTLTPTDSPAAASTGYAEGHVVTTRFGSYPHSTLLGLPWGSQVRASVVDTGSRGQKRAHSGAPSSRSDQAASPRKRPRSDNDVKQAATGFCHVLPLTPESWTVSLPHRTQVVYTPDYSFVVQKLRVRPGSRVIEAGGGSGSFMHAAARAAYGKGGRVFTFEYHAVRCEMLRRDVREHGLEGVVSVGLRDVYKEGFWVEREEEEEEEEKATLDDMDVDVEDNTQPPKLSATSVSPNANAVFLDLPDPSLALRHLTRASPSPLDPTRPVHLSAFLPCIEQVQKFIASLRTYNWLEIRMFDIAHRRLEVRRERVGLDFEGLRGVNASPASVEESMNRLKELQARDKEFREISSARSKAKNEGGVEVKEEDEEMIQRGACETRQERLERIKRDAESRKEWKEGRAVVRTEPEVKNHTSYLVFATLPVEWSEEDEKKCIERWGSGSKGKKAGRG